MSEGFYLGLLSVIISSSWNDMAVILVVSQKKSGSLLGVVILRIIGGCQVLSFVDFLRPSLKRVRGYPRRCPSTYSGISSLSTCMLGYLDPQGSL